MMRSEHIVLSAFAFFNLDRTCIVYYESKDPHACSHRVKFHEGIEYDNDSQSAVTRERDEVDEEAGGGRGKVRGRCRRFTGRRGRCQLG